MPARYERATKLAGAAPAHVATYGITPEALTFYADGKPALVIDQHGLDGLILRLTLARMESG